MEEIALKQWNTVALRNPFPRSTTGVRSNPMCTIVTEREQVVRNVEQFNADLERNTDIVSQLNMFRHWYFIEESRKFVHSKYIGYEGIDTEWRYLSSLIWIRSRFLLSDIVRQTSSLA